MTIGGRNHATVLHSCKAVANLMETDKNFRLQVEEIEKKVLALSGRRYLGAEIDRGYFAIAEKRAGEAVSVYGG